MNLLCIHCHLNKIYLHFVAYFSKYSTVTPTTALNICYSSYPKSCKASWHKIQRLLTFQPSLKPNMITAHELEDYAVHLIFSNFYSM